MTPTPAVLLLVALFWTLPASVAAYVYKKHDASLANVKRAAWGSIAPLTGNRVQPQPTQSDV